jgi:hypothetical protein
MSPVLSVTYVSGRTFTSPPALTQAPTPKNPLSLLKYPSNFQLSVIEKLKIHNFFSLKINVLTKLKACYEIA